MKITRERDEELVVRIPLKTRRFNPYNEMVGGNPDTGEMWNIVGVIESHEGYEDIGFMYLQDMDYKGKNDQLTDWAVKWHNSREGFEELCNELKIPLWYV